MQAQTWHAEEDNSVACDAKTLGLIQDRWAIAKATVDAVKDYRKAKFLVNTVSKLMSKQRTHSSAIVSCSRWIVQQNGPVLWCSIG